MSSGIVLNPPNRNLGPIIMSQPTKMAVAAYFPFDGTRPDRNGVSMDWPWAMKQWDRVAQGGKSVRLVVADQAYSQFNPTTQVSQVQEMHQKVDACRAQGQLVFGYVYGAGGVIPVGPPGSKWTDKGKSCTPGTGTTCYPCVGDQIAAWQTLYSSRMDGIYIDVGPTWCFNTSPIPGLNDPTGGVRPLEWAVIMPRD
jgi:hypothetical protein